MVGFVMAETFSTMFTSVSSTLWYLCLLTVTHFDQNAFFYLSETTLDSVFIYSVESQQCCILPNITKNHIELDNYQKCLWILWRKEITEISTFTLYKLLC